LTIRHIAGPGLVELAKSRLGGVPVPIMKKDSPKGCPYKVLSFKFSLILDTLSVYLSQRRSKTAEASFCTPKIPDGNN
jgi:hypothetical protein